MYATAFIDGRPVPDADPDVQSVSISLPAEDGLTYCAHCGEPIAEYPAGWEHAGTCHPGCDPSPDCDECGQSLEWANGEWEHVDPDDGFSCGTPTYAEDTAEPAPLSWCNSACVYLDPDGDAVHVSISVGDPRGGFQMTVRRLPDGRLVLHLPHENQGLSHRPLVPLHPGMYEVR